MDSINGFSQEFLKKEDMNTQTRYDLDDANGQDNESSHVTKIFVGGLPPDLTVEEFKAYFEQFGIIEDAVVMVDKATSRPRGFGFVTFDSEETANNVVKNRFYELKNKRVEVKKAVSKERMSGKYGNYYDTYNTMYNGNFGVYHYGFNGYGYGYGAYNGLGGLSYGYEGPSYFYYPYQSPNPNTSMYDNIYSYQSPYYYGNTPYGSDYSHICKNRTSVVVTNPNVKDGADLYVARKEKEETKCDNLKPRGPSDDEHVQSDVLVNGDCDNGKVSEGSTGEEHAVSDVLEKAHCKNGKVSEGSSGEEHVATYVLEKADCDNGKVTEGLSLCCTGEGDGGCAKDFQCLSLCRDGSSEQMGVDGQSSSCTSES